MDDSGNITLALLAVITQSNLDYSASPPYDPPSSNESSKDDFKAVEFKSDDNLEADISDTEMLNLSDGEVDESDKKYIYSSADVGVDNLILARSLGTVDTAVMVDRSFAWPVTGMSIVSK